MEGIWGNLKTHMDYIIDVCLDSLIQPSLFTKSNHAQMHTLWKKECMHIHSPVK
jgi:hypothetical protein